MNFRCNVNFGVKSRLRSMHHIYTDYEMTGTNHTSKKMLEHVSYNIKKKCTELTVSVHSQQKCISCVDTIPESELDDMQVTY
jgi:hypothetical protein